MKKTHHLIRLAQQLSSKYAQAQSLKEIIENAAGYGELSTNGIMNFPAQLKKDNAGLSIVVSVTDQPWGGKKIYVGEPTVNPPEVAGNYSKLAGQIKKYLDKNINYFPQIPMGHTLLDFPREEKPDSELASEYLAENPGYLKSLR